MITCEPLAMAPMASHGGICEASSKMTVSNPFSVGSRYCATLKGLINTQGFMLRKNVGMTVNSLRIGRCRRFNSSWRLKMGGSLPGSLREGIAL